MSSSSCCSSSASYSGTLPSPPRGVACMLCTPPGTVTPFIYRILSRNVYIGDCAACMGGGWSPRTLPSLRGVGNYFFCAPLGRLHRVDITLCEKPIQSRNPEKDTHKSPVRASPGYMWRMFVFSGRPFPRTTLAHRLLVLTNQTCLVNGKQGESYSSREHKV